MRRLFFLSVVFVGCSTFGTEDEVPASTPPAVEAGTPGPVDAGPPDGPVDAGPPDDGAPSCVEASETLPAARDAIVAYNQQPLADQNVCNLSVADCLLAFDLVASKGKTVVGL